MDLMFTFPTFYRSDRPYRISLKLIGAQGGFGPRYFVFWKLLQLRMECGDMPYIFVFLQILVRHKL